MEFTESCVLSQTIGAAVHPFVIQSDLGVRADIIVYHHLLAAHHGHPPHLVGIQPAYMHARSLPASILQVQKHNILDAGLKIRVAVRVHPYGRAIQPVVDDGDIVRSEVPQGIDILTNDAQVQALGVDVIDIAQLARVDIGLHLAHSRVVEKHMPDHEDKPLRVGQFHKLAGFFRGSGQGFLHEDVLARAQYCTGQLEMGVHRRSQHDGIHIGIGEETGEI